jgi:hypothetical protein
MTANEMADLLIQFDSGRIWEHAQEIATTLRQQQAEIEALKELLNEFGITVKRRVQEK